MELATVPSQEVTSCFLEITFLRRLDGRTDWRTQTWPHHLRRFGRIRSLDARSQPSPTGHQAGRLFSRCRVRLATDWLRCLVDHHPSKSHQWICQSHSNRHSYNKTCQLSIQWASAVQLVIDVRCSVSSQKVNAGRTMDKWFVDADGWNVNTSGQIDFNGEMLVMVSKSQVKVIWHCNDHIYSYGRLSHIVLHAMSLLIAHLMCSCAVGLRPFWISLANVFGGHGDSSQAALSHLCSHISALTGGYRLLLFAWTRSPYAAAASHSISVVTFLCD